MAEYKLEPHTTFEDLRRMYGTGRAFTTGTDRLGNKKYTYRNGVMTKLGDIEESEWIFLIKALIAREGEEEMQRWLVEWYANDHVPRTPEKLEQEALEAHAARLFDNEAWANFIPFNQKYRPTVLETADLITVITDCCKTKMVVTRKQFEQPLGNMIYCPNCNGSTTIYLYEGG